MGSFCAQGHGRSATDPLLMNDMDRLDALKEAIGTHVIVTSRDARIIGPGPLGMRLLPWIFDFRAIMLKGEILNLYAELFWERYHDSLPFQVGGLESAAIPLVSAIVMKSIERGTPVNGFYIRKSRKREGLMRQIEGTLTNDPVILVDDLVNSGSTFHKQLTVLAGSVAVRDLFAIVAFRDVTSYTLGARVQSLFTLADFGLMAETPQEDPGDPFTVLWRTPIAPPSFEHVVQKSAPLCDGTHIYMGTDAGIFAALDARDGTVQWTFRVGRHPEGKGIFSSPALHNGTVYFGAYDGAVYALDAKTGARKWAYEDADWVGSSPALDPANNTLYIGLEFGLFRKRGGIAALDMATGAKKWDDRTPALTHGSPLHIPEETMVVIGSNDGILYAYDAVSGARRWVFLTHGEIKTRPAYDPLRRLILVPSMDSRLFAISHTGEARWAYQMGGPIYSNPLVRGRTVYVASLDKFLYAIDLESGKKVWEFETGGRIFSSPVADGDTLYIGSNDGILYEIEATTGALRGKHQFSERIVNAVALGKSRIFVPTVANEVYCLARAKKEGHPSGGPQHRA